jgi:HEAT repeat protein
MGLRKTSTPAGGLRRVEPRDYDRNAHGLIHQLQDPDGSTRRWAARDLAEFPEAAQALCTRLMEETDRSVREVICTTLTRIGGPATVEGLLPLLRSEDANLRNSAIEVLSSLPMAVGPRVESLLNDTDPDVRIFTVNLLGELKHPEVTSWLKQVLQHDTHVNVVAAAIEVLAEVGSPKVIPALNEARKRFADDPFIGFAADMAQQRIEAP